MRSLRAAALAVLFAALATLGGRAQAQPLATIGVDAVSLGTPAAIAAALRRPASGSAHVGIVVMHPYGSYKDFAGCEALARRGFVTLCIDSVFTNDQYGYYGYEQHAPAIAAGVRYLRGLPGITKVLLFGHSAGAPMMTFYENVAENGSGVCSDAAKLSPCVTTNLAGLPRADGLILFDSHIGDALATLTYIDPAVIDNRPGRREPALDMFAAENGYDPKTNGAHYSPAFLRAYLTAQAARNATITAEAQRLLAQARATSGNPALLGDDIPFAVAGATSARLWQPDLDVLRCTRHPVLLLAHDGTRPRQVVCSVRPPSGAGAAALTAAATVSVNVHVWLGAHAMRTTSPSAYLQAADDISGLEYGSTATSAVSNITGVRTPLLIVANGGHYFLRPDEIIYETARVPDKTFAIEEGAVHGGTECVPCENLRGLPVPAGPGTFGFYGDTFGRTMDFMAEWIARRY